MTPVLDGQLNVSSFLGCRSTITIYKSGAMEPIYVQDSDEEEIYEEINDDVKQLVKIFQNNRQFGIPIKSFISKLTPEFNELSDYIANLIKKLSYEEEKVAWECIKNQLFLDINQYDVSICS